MRTLKDKLADPRAQRVLGFFVAKGLLRTNRPMARPQGKIRVPDVLWVARHVEPRVLETFPAALIHFPAAFTETDRIPKAMRAIIEAIEQGEERGPDHKNFPYARMKRWANLRLADGRTKPLDQKRRNKTFRLAPSVLTSLETLAEHRGTTQTQIVEDLIRKAAARAGLRASTEGRHSSDLQPEG